MMSRLEKYYHPAGVDQIRLQDAECLPRLFICHRVGIIDEWTVQASEPVGIGEGVDIYDGVADLHQEYHEAGGVPVQFAHDDS